MTTVRVYPMIQVYILCARSEKMYDVSKMCFCGVGGRVSEEEEEEEVSFILQHTTVCAYSVLSTTTTTFFSDSQKVV